VDRKKNSLIQQIYKFNVVGVINNALMYSLYSVMVYVGVYYEVALAVDYVFGGIFSYLFNKSFTFNDYSHHSIVSIYKMIILLASLFFVNLFVLKCLIDGFGYGYYLSQFIAIFIVSVCSFYFQKMHIFLRSDP